MARKRERWLDGLKGFAILLVILGHVLSGYWDAWTFPDAWVSFYIVRNWIYSFHMPLFFLISGFTFTLAYYRDGQLKTKNYLRQLFNLFFIYVVFALIQWGIKLLVPELVNEVYTWDTLKRMFVEPLGNFWYVYVLLVFYLLAALLHLPKWPGLWALFFGGVAIVAADAHLDWNYLTLYRILYHLFFFFLGCCLCRHRELLKNQKLLGLSFMFLVTAAWFFFFGWVYRWFANWKVGIAAATSFVFLYQFYRFPKLSGFPLFQICGKYCLELYLLHTFFTAGLRTLLPIAGITTPWLSVWSNFILSTGLSLGLAWLSGRFWAMDLLFRPARFYTELNNRRKKTG